jgi:Protein of unknown function (DUF3892)
MNFCELDSHLQPWDKDSRLKKPWTESYDRARIWDMAPEVLAASGTQRAEVLWKEPVALSSNQRYSFLRLDLPLLLIEPLLNHEPVSNGRWNREVEETQMARYLRIRSIVRTERTGAHERIDAICGLTQDGGHWTLTHEDAVSQVDNGSSAFYIERPGCQRREVIVAMDVHAHRYLKTEVDRDHPDQLLFLPSCPHIAHTPIDVRKHTNSWFSPSLSR